MELDTKIITIANQKGGCGKTTITMQLAGTLGKDGYKVFVVDADPQGTATRWVAASDEFTFPVHVAGLSAAGEKVHKEVQKYIGSYDYIFIDCPPSIKSLIPQSALMVSDLVIIPVIPSPADLWAAVGIQELIERIQIVNEDLKSLLVPNMCQNNQNLTQDALKLLKTFDIKISNSHICLRTAYKQSAALGKTVHDLKGSEKASKEIRSLTEEVMSLLDN
jgi:chromosome partitioning protein